MKTPEHVAMVFDAIVDADVDADEAHLRSARAVLAAALESGVHHLTLCLETATGILDGAAARRLAAALRNDSDAAKRSGLAVHVAERSGRNDLAGVTRLLAHKVRSGELRPDDVSLELIQKYLDSADAPDPDLIILCGRRAGAGRPQKLSACLLFESAYAEFHFCPVRASDFHGADWQRALADFSQRDRRFGRAPEPTLDPAVDPALDAEKTSARFSASGESAAVSP